jgi:Arc/MetJ family transcription regulator
MRAHSVLDGKPVSQAMKLARVKTMREAVTRGLPRFVRSGRQRRFLDLHGTGGAVVIWPAAARGKRRAAAATA